MPNDIDDQIASYFTWVEGRTGFSLHAPESRSGAEARTAPDDASVIELAAAHAWRSRSRRIRVAAVCGIAAALVLVGVIAIQHRATPERQVPGGGVPSSEPQGAQDAAARRLQAERALQAEQAARQAAEAAARQRAAASTTTVVAPVLVSPPDAAVPVLPGSSIQNARMTSATSGWVVTDAAVARSADGGATWQTRPFPPSVSPDGGGRTQSFILDDDHAWVMAVDATGQVVVGSATGSSAPIATTVLDPGFTGGTPAGIVFVDDQTGYASIVRPGQDNGPLAGRAAVMRTTDGGATFQLVDADAPKPLAFIDARTGWGSGGGLFLTTDGAATWTQVHPPLWDSIGPDPNGPSYQIVFTSPALTVVKVVAPTGTQAQVAYAATDDLGTTWRDVAPPDTSESDNSGSRSMLDAVSPTTWFAIAQGDGATSILWTTTDGGASYSKTDLPFPARTVTMSTPTTGWATTETGISMTTDGGTTWTKVADLPTP